MSFISVVMTENFSSVVSDGRVRGSGTNKILDENFMKIRKYGTNVIGIVGNPDYFKIIDGFIDKHHLSLTRGVLSYIIKESLNLNLRQTDGGIPLANIALTGKDENGILYFEAHSNTSGSAQQVQNVEIMKGNHQIRYFTFPPNDSLIDTDKSMKELFDSRKIQSMDDIVKIQIDLNNLVAKSAHSVNTITTSIIIS